MLIECQHRKEETISIRNGNDGKSSTPFYFVNSITQSDLIHSSAFSQSDYNCGKAFEWNR
jgi:hypothetical protein